MAAAFPEASRPHSTCRMCVARHRGLCKGIADEDATGSACLEAAHSTTRVYDAGDFIYAQGDLCENVFIVVTGWVGLHRDLPDGRRQLLRFLQCGAHFGSEQLGQEMGHGATALTNASVCPIKRTKFDELRRLVPAFNEHYVATLESEGRQAFEVQTVLGQGCAKERVGRLIADLVDAATTGAKFDVGKPVRIPITQRHIAEATGLTAIHVNRILRQLREEHVFELRNGSISECNPSKLAKFTDPGMAVDGRSPTGLSFVA